MLFSVPWCWCKAGEAGMQGYQPQLYSHIPNPVTPILPSSAHASPSHGAWALQPEGSSLQQPGLGPTAPLLGWTQGLSGLTNNKCLYKGPGQGWGPMVACGMGQGERGLWTHAHACPTAHLVHECGSSSLCYGKHRSSWCSVAWLHSSKLWLNNHRFENSGAGHGLSHQQSHVPPGRVPSCKATKN